MGRGVARAAGPPEAEDRLDYETILRRHVLPALADSPVGAIDKPAMKRFASDMADGGAGADSYGTTW